MSGLLPRLETKNPSWSASGGHGAATRLPGDPLATMAAMWEFVVKENHVAASQGFTYGVDYFTYYDVRSEFTFTPTSANAGDILQCHMYGVLRSVTLQLLVHHPFTTEEGPHIPWSNILDIRTREIKGEGNTVTLVITCHVDLSDQPFPHLHTYSIMVGNRTLSTSSCPSAIISPLAPGCVDITCSATNGYGETVTRLGHCREESPAAGGPIANPHRSVLQQLSTTYALVVVIFVLCIITVIMKRKGVY
ncbi:uncharacterized protein [Diadema setosum]|uniref:uncharacterized protein n=1 Tax=Diadema setosum TaxID=31175 RepID=UPI003B3AEEB5